MQLAAHAGASLKGNRSDGALLTPRAVEMHETRVEEIDELLPMVDNLLGVLGDARFRCQSILAEANRPMDAVANV